MGFLGKFVDLYAADHAARAAIEDMLRTAPENRQITIKEASVLVGVRPATLQRAITAGRPGYPRFYRHQGRRAWWTTLADIREWRERAEPRGGAL